MCSTPSWKKDTGAAAEAPGGAGAGAVDGTVAAAPGSGRSTNAVNLSRVSVTQATTLVLVAAPPPADLASCTHVTCWWPGDSFERRLEKTCSDRRGSPSGGGYSTSNRTTCGLSVDARTLDGLTTL